MTKDALLAEITTLSHEFGVPKYIKAGGGNTSAKDATTMWIKPSGITLLELQPATFVAVSRDKVAELYTVTPPPDVHDREAMVKDMVVGSVCPGYKGRPSVETPLHNAFEVPYVVHTHPPMVNGMTCATGGRARCAKLFPDSVWVEFIDPGYALSIHVRNCIETYKKQHGKEPTVVFMENHGVLVAGQTPADIRKTYADIHAVLQKEYDKAGIPVELKFGPAADAATIEKTKAQIKATFGEAAAGVAYERPFQVAQGPISPDHIVYMRTHAFFGEPTPENAAEFAKKHKFKPRIIVCKAGVFGLGPTEKEAGLAIELARDGAVIMQLAPAFGGIQYMTQRAVDFIDSWEVEAYRRSLVAAK